MVTENNRGSQVFQTKWSFKGDLIQFKFNARHTNCAIFQDQDRIRNGKAAHYIHLAVVPGGRAEIEGDAREIVVGQLEKDKAIYPRPRFCTSNQTPAPRERTRVLWM